MGERAEGNLKTLPGKFFLSALTLLSFPSESLFKVNKKM